MHTDHANWLDARSSWNGWLEKPELKSPVLMAENTLAKLPRMCCWPSGLPRSFDQFRRRFNYSRERAQLLNAFIADIQLGGKSHPDFVESPDQWISQMKANVRVIRDLLWLTYAGINDFGSTAIPHPKISLYLEASPQFCVETRGDKKAQEAKCNCSFNKGIPCIQVFTDTALFLTKHLRYEERNSPTFTFDKLQQPGKMSGWSSIAEDLFEQFPAKDSDKFPLVNGISPDEPQRLLPFDIYRIFYEDDRAQIIYSIGAPKVGGIDSLRLLAMNGVGEACAHTACEQFTADQSCKADIYHQLECGLIAMPQVDPKKGDWFKRFLLDAVKPFIDYKGRWMNTVKTGEDDLEWRSIGAAIAVPAAKISTTRKDRLDDAPKGTFAFLNLVLRWSADLAQPANDACINNYIYQRINYLQEPLLRELADSRENALKRLNEIQKNHEIILKVIDEPLRFLTQNLIKAQHMTQRINSSLFSPSASIFSSVNHVIQYFDENKPMEFGGVPWISSHSGASMSSENILNTIAATVLTTLGIDPLKINEKLTEKKLHDYISNLFINGDPKLVSVTDEQKKAIAIFRTLLSDFSGPSTNGVFLDANILTTVHTRLKRVFHSPFKPEAREWALLPLMVVLFDLPMGSQDVSSSGPKVIICYKDGDDEYESKKIGDLQSYLSESDLNNSPLDNLLSSWGGRPPVFPIAQYSHFLDFINGIKSQENKSTIVNIYIRIFSETTKRGFALEIDFTKDGFEKIDFENIFKNMKLIMDNKLAAGVQGDIKLPWLLLAERCRGAIAVEPDSLNTQISIFSEYSLMTLNADAKSYKISIEFRSESSSS